jgi:hypothetical protein
MKSRVGMLMAFSLSSKTGTPIMSTSDPSRPHRQKGLLFMGLAFSVHWASAFSAGKVALVDCPPLAL